MLAGEKQASCQLGRCYIHPIGAEALVDRQLVAAECRITVEMGGGMAGWQAVRSEMWNPADHLISSERASCSHDTGSQHADLLLVAQTVRKPQCYQMFEQMTTELDRRRGGAGSGQ